MKPVEKIIYLDNNATTQIDERVLNEMMPFLRENYANASSTHSFGIGAYEAVKAARGYVAELIGAETNEVVFTSGATEAINLAIKGVAECYCDKGKHIITVSTEHTAVLDTCKYLQSKGYDITYLPVEETGVVNISELKKAVRTDTILVSVMLSNNETGVIQPIKEISELAHNAGAIFMSDCTQAIGKIPVKVDELGIDILCFSGHKIYAPKGVGCLFVRQRRPHKAKILPLIHGGGHEKGMRSGTLNVPSIVALGKACQIAQSESKKDAERIGKLRDYLETELLKIPDTHVNGSTSSRMFNVTNVLFKGADSDAIIVGLSSTENTKASIAVSNGSACTSASIEPSHVLLSMGMTEEEAFSSIRFSLGRFNTKEEIDITVKEVNRVVTKLREMVQL